MVLMMKPIRRFASQSQNGNVGSILFRGGQATVWAGGRHSYYLHFNGCQTPVNKPQPGCGSFGEIDEAARDCRAPVFNTHGDGAPVFEIRDFDFRAQRQGSVRCDKRIFIKRLATVSTSLKGSRNHQPEGSQVLRASSAGTR